MGCLVLLMSSSNSLNAHVSVTLAHRTNLVHLIVSNTVVVSVEHIHSILVLNSILSSLPLLLLENLLLPSGVEELLAWVSPVTRIVHAWISTTCNNHAFEVRLYVCLKLTMVASVDLHLILRIDACRVRATVASSFIAPAVHTGGLSVTHAAGVAIHVRVYVKHSTVALHLRSCGSNIAWHMHHVHRASSHSALLVVVVAEVSLCICVKLQVLGQLLLLQHPRILNSSGVIGSHISRKMLLHVQDLSIILTCVDLVASSHVLPRLLPEVLRNSLNILWSLAFEHV